MRVSVSASEEIANSLNKASLFKKQKLQQIEKEVGMTRQKAYEQS